MPQFKKLDISNPYEVLFMFGTRNHPEIEKWMLSSKESNFKDYIEELKNTREGTTVYICSEDGKFFGYFLVSYWKRGIENAHEDSATLGFIIHSDFQNKKLGQWMVQQSLDILKDYKNGISLCVNNNNVRAIHIYEKFGFKMSIEDEKFSWYSL